jgi:hypothetical protein
VTLPVKNLSNRPFSSVNASETSFGQPAPTTPPGPRYAFGLCNSRYGGIKTSCLFLSRCYRETPPPIRRATPAWVPTLALVAAVIGAVSCASTRAGEGGPLEQLAAGSRASAPEDLVHHKGFDRVGI